MGDSAVLHIEPRAQLFVHFVSDYLLTCESLYIDDAKMNCIAHAAGMPKCLVFKLKHNRIGLKLSVPSLVEMERQMMSRGTAI